MTNPIENFPAVIGMADTYGMPTNALLHTMSVMAMPKGHTNEELVTCLMVAREHNLNPLTKEIYFMRTKAGQIQPIISVDGWISKANSHPQYNGVRFETVHDDAGKIVGMKCWIYRKDRDHPTEIYEDLEECMKSGGAVWKTNPIRMLRNRTFVQCARLAFGLAGVMAHEEYQAWQGENAIPVDITPPVSDYEDYGDAPVEVVLPRDGGWLPKQKRLAANSFKEDPDNNKRFQEVEASINSALTLDELRAIFDAHADGDMAWCRYPQAYANLLQEAYKYALKDLNKITDAVAEEGDDGTIINPETGEVEDDRASLVKAVNAATSMMQLDELWQTLSEDERDGIAEVYTTKLEELA